MRSSLKSRQYANLLLKLGDNQNALEPVYRSMLDFFASYRHEPELKAFLASTKIVPEDKIKVLGAVYADLHPICQVFIAQLGEERDLKLLGEIVKSLEPAYYQRSNQVKVHVVSTGTLPDTVEEQIQNVIKSVTSRKADFTASVDKDILGGLTLRVGNTILDGSLSSKLVRIRNSLVQS
ncbi:MAG: ATP synthase F1 subunit delta [Candidatus Marinimicrobia bacterium]|nr:ATP synthase F1 subunit delta [Candidatus Neomarinimicrobiota bacterium]MCF7850753.1 ATP synthase F1 subunit delta [Candidatus Neomarinimicrobiota bacterium]MCF7904251.1 ATP synthase F1 subunit delta [Candidatus Neomarinimicrobiota bacterium]